MSTDEGLENDSLASTIEGVVWGLAPVAIVVICLRLYTRIVIVGRMALDDHIMLLAIVIMIKNSCFVQVSLHYGLGRHITTLSPEDAMHAIKWDYMAQPSSIMAPTFGRISFALLLLSLVGISKTRRLFLWAIIISQFVANSLCFIFILVQCKPIELLWNKSLEGECWDLKFQEYFGYFDGALNSFTDLVLAIAPAVVFWNLNMKRSMKISLSLLMGLGIFAMVGSIVKTISLSSVGSHNDYTYNTSHLVIWYSVENYLVIIAASIPTLKPLIAKRKKSTSGSSGVTSSMARRAKARAASREDELDDIPLTSIGAYHESIDGESSQRNFLEFQDGNRVRDIRKTVDVSVNYNESRARD